MVCSSKQRNPRKWLPCQKLILMLTKTLPKKLNPNLLIVNIQPSLESTQLEGERWISFICVAIPVIYGSHVMKLSGRYFKNPTHMSWIPKLIISYQNKRLLSSVFRYPILLSTCHNFLTWWCFTRSKGLPVPTYTAQQLVIKQKTFCMFKEFHNKAQVRSME